MKTSSIVLPVLHISLGGLCFVGLWLAAWRFESGEWLPLVIIAGVVGALGATVSGWTAYLTARFSFVYSILFSGVAVIVVLVSLSGLPQSGIRPFGFWALLALFMFSTSFLGGVVGRAYAKRNTQPPA